jgi:heat shock protein HslJ
MLLTAGLAVTLLVIPTLSMAQPEAAADAARVPLARQPDGRLPLVGTPWRLLGYTQDGREGVPGPEVAAFIEFDTRRYEGSGGCAKVAGEYGATGEALVTKPKKIKERDCAENLMAVQQAVEGGLKRVASYEIVPGAEPLQDQLVLYSVTGIEVLRYGLDDLAPLDGGEWRLESYAVDGEMMPASEEMPGLLSFRPAADAVYKRRQSGRLSGTSGCNGIVAEFHRRSDILSLRELDLTDAPCTSELTAQESAMTAVLDAAAMRIDLPPDRLVLTSADTEDRLEFVSQVPLEGTTWWLSSTAADGGTGGERYTIRLEGGTLSGEGPCGAYSAEYVTDGAFITFTEAKGTRDADCSELRTEQALISGLRRAVVVERRVGRLDFRDARGNTTLTFDRPFAP